MIIWFFIRRFSIFWYQPSFSSFLEYNEDLIKVKDDTEVTIDDVEVEEILQFALEEKRGKQEAVQVLSQLQANYDDVQRKLAEAENKIDKYR